MNLSRRLLCSLLAVLSPGVFIPSVQAQGLPDHFPDANGVGPGNQRYDYTYWAPTDGTTAWSSNSWSWFYYNINFGHHRGIRWYEVSDATSPLNNAFYAVFWDTLNSGPPETFKTVDLNTDILARGLHFRHEGWNIQDADGANTLTLISGTLVPNVGYSDDRQAITMDTRSQATISANVVLGAFFSSSDQSDGNNQYIAMGEHSSLTISGNISETGTSKALHVLGGHAQAGAGSVLTLSGNNTFTGGVTVGGSNDTPYVRTLTPRLNINSAQALGTGALTVRGGSFILGNTSGAAVTVTNPLALYNTTAGTTANNYNVNAPAADRENLIFDAPHDLTFNSDVTLTAHRSIRVEDGGGDLILAGRILDGGSTPSSLFKNGPGKLVLSGTDSTYTGVTQINGGILEVTHLADAGEASSIGASANTIAKNLTGIYGVHVSTSATSYSTEADVQVPSLLLSNGGTLRYVGSGDSTDRLIGLFPGRRTPADLVTTPVSLDASGTGALSFTNSGAVVHIHNMNLFRVLNLTGTNTDDNTFNLALTDITGNTNPFPVVRNQLTKSGAGKWILTGTNTHTGGTTVYDGTLQLGDSGTVLADTGAVIVNGGTFRLGAANETIGSLSGTGGTVDLFNGSGRTLTLGGTVDAHYAGAIVGADGSLVKTGAATQTLSGANSYTGTTTINAGTLQFARTSAFYDDTIDGTTAARLTVASGATAGFNVGGAGEFTPAHLDTLRANGHFAANSFLGLDTSNAPSGTFTYTSDIDGVLGLAKLGNGTLVLSGANSYTGPTAVRAGTLAFLNTNAFYGGTIDATTAAKLLVSSGATAQFNVGGAGEFTASNLDVLFTNGGFAAGSSLGIDTTNTSGGTFVYASNLDGHFGLTKAGSGTLVLAGANTYTGPTTVTAGTLLLNDSGTSLTAATDVIVKSAGTLQLGASDQTIGSLAGDGTVQLRNGTGRALTLGGSTTTNFSGSLAGSGGSLVKAGSGRQTLSGTNTYDGATAITGGTLQFAKTSAFYNGTIDATTAARLSVASGSTAAFNVGGTGEFTSPHLQTVLGNANFATGAVLGLDTTHSSGGTFTHAGNIGGEIGLTKLGTGTLVLSGANSYTGRTTVEGGTLQFANTSAFYGGVIDSTTAAKLSLTSGSTLAFNYGGEGEFTQAQYSILRTSGVFTAGTMLGLDTTNAVNGVASFGTTGAHSHGLIKSGSGTLILTSAVTSVADTVVLEGTLRFASKTSFYSYSLTPSVLARLSVASGATATMGVGTGPSDFTAADMTKIFAHAKFASGSTLGLHTNTDFTYGDVIDGAFALRKFGDHTLTLTAPSAHTGGTVVTEGTLQLGMDHAVGLGKPDVTVDGGTLALDSFKQKVGAFVLDSGSVTGSGTANIFGTLIADSFDLRSGSITANLAGSGSLTKSGSGTVVLTGTNTYTGTTRVTGGTLQLGADNRLPSNTAVTVSAGATLDLAGSIQRIGSLSGSGGVTLGAGKIKVGSDHSSTTFSGGLSGAGGRLTKIGTGALTLTGTNTYTGLTTVAAGKLVLDGSLTSDVTVQSGATFGGDGFVDGNITLEAGSTLAPVGSLAAGSLTWNAGAAFVFTLGDAGTSDLLELTGSLTKGGEGTFAFTFIDGGWQAGQTYTLISIGGTTFAANDFTFTNGGGFTGTFSIEDGALAFTMGAIPEPAAFALLAGAGALAMAALRRRRKTVEV